MCFSRFYLVTKKLEMELEKQEMKPKYKLLKKLSKICKVSVYSLHHELCKLVSARIILFSLFTIVAFILLLLLEGALEKIKWLKWCPLLYCFYGIHAVGRSCESSAQIALLCNIIKAGDEFHPHQLWWKIIRSCIFNYSLFVLNTGKWVHVPWIFQDYQKW